VLWRKLLEFNERFEGRIASSSYVQLFNLKKIFNHPSRSERTMARR
jgi:hypothetical protein